MKKERKKMYKKGLNKKGQVTIFIIIAIVIVAVLLILFFPRIKILISGPVAPDYVKQCTEDSVREVLGKVEVQGGSLNPENFILYEGNKVEYVCYTNEYYKRCTMQKPFLKQDIESEITNYIEPKVRTCINELKAQLENRGSQVSLGSINVKTEIIPNSVLITINAPMTVTKSGTEKYEKFKVDISSKLYDLLMISSSIANYEARYGDSDSMTYMLYYPDIKVEKNKLDEGKVYILTDKTTNEKFIFASRSLAWPAGYDLEKTK